MKRIRFPRIMVNETVCVRQDGEVEMREVGQQPTQNIDDSNVRHGVTIFAPTTTLHGVSQQKRSGLPCQDEVVQIRLQTHPKFLPPPSTERLHESPTKAAPSKHPAFCFFEAKMGPGDHLRIRRGPFGDGRCSLCLWRVPWSGRMTCL